MRLNKLIRVSGTNQFGTNTCHHNKKSDQTLIKTFASTISRLSKVSNN
jgi:hypothetical protein